MPGSSTWTKQPICGPRWLWVINHLTCTNETTLMPSIPWLGSLLDQRLPELRAEVLNNLEGPRNIWKQIRKQTCLYYMYKKIDWQSIVYVLLCLYENITPKECLNVCQFHLDLILQLPRFGLFRIHLAKRFDDVFDACRNICDLMTQTICHVLGQHELHLRRSTFGCKWPSLITELRCPWDTICKWWAHDTCI